MNPRIAIEGLSKRYGSFQALRDLSFQVNEGSVFGLLGPNGAGKTTTFKCILGFTRPTAGNVRYDGEPFAPAVFDRLAYLPEQSALYAWMTVEQHLEAARRTYARFDLSRARELLGRFGVDARKRVKTLSKGQRTATALTLAFALRPEILILDEPASGLDPIHQRDVLDLIIDAAAGGASVLFSSHQITQVERAADHVAILAGGRMRLQGEVDTLKSERKIVEAVFDRPADAVSLRSPAIGRIETIGRTLRVHVESDGEAVVQELNALGPSSLSVIDQNLEDIFLDAVSTETKELPR